MNKFLKIFQVIIFLSVVFLLSINIALAAVKKPVLSPGSEVLNINFDDKPCTYVTEGNVKYCQINWIGQYISGIYRYGISLAAVLAVVMVMVGGFIWLSSGGSADRIKTAKNYIGSAFAGLLLALFAFVILNTINPRLVNLDPLKIQSIKQQDVSIVGEGAALCCNPDGGNTLGDPWWKGISEGESCDPGWALCLNNQRCQPSGCVPISQGRSCNSARCVAN